MKTLRAIFDSKRSDAGTATKPNFYLEPYLRNVVGFSIDMVIVPNTMYVINSHNNSLQFLAADGTSFSTTIGIKDYTPSELATVVEDALNATDTDASRTYTCDYDSETLKFTLATNQLSGFTLGFGGLNAVLGFGYNVSIDQSGTEGTKMGDLNLPEYLLLKSKTLGQLLCNSGTYLNGVQKSNTLCAIPMTEGFGSFVHYTPQYRYEFSTPENHINNIEFELVNPDNNSTAELNGYGFTVSITFYCE